jgi:hypothetical protein
VDTVGTPFAPILSRIIARRMPDAIDVVDDARSRHRGAIEWFVEDESHERSRPHASYHDRIGEIAAGRSVNLRLDLSV